MIEIWFLFSIESRYRRRKYMRETHLRKARMRRVRRDVSKTYLERAEVSDESYCQLEGEDRILC